MNPSQAKEILSAHDLKESDKLPAEAQEALEIAKADPELSEWLEESQQFDQQILGALGEIPIPENLEQQILQAAQDQAAEDKVVLIEQEEQTSHFGRRVFLVAAAAVVLLLAGGTLYTLFPPKVEFPGNEFSSAETFRDHMALYANSRFWLDQNTSELSEARTWLEENEYPTFEEIPQQIAQFKGMGCKAIDWGEHKVGLVCFKNGEDQIVHLFVIRRDALENLDAIGTDFGSIAVHRDLQTGGWSDGEFAYLFVGSEPEVEIGNLLAAN